MSGQLAGADLSPAGVPPSAVLVVRRLADPLPGRLEPRPGTVRTDPAWQAAVRSQLEELHGFASRPSDGLVPASAVAVCFRDRAEMLACLVRDRVTVGLDGWWWRSLRKVLPDEPAQLLAEHPRELPAIVARLVEMGALRDVASALDGGDAMTILSSMVADHRLDPSLAPAGRDLARPPDPLPWVGWLPASADDAPTAEHSALLGIALGLAHSPAEVRSVRFVAEVRGWWRRAGAVAGEPDTSVPGASPGRAEAGDSGPAETSSAPMHAAPQPEKPRQKEPGQKVRQKVAVAFGQATQKVAVAFGEPGADTVEPSDPIRVSPDNPENPTAAFDDPARNSVWADELGAREAGDMVPGRRVSALSDGHRAADAAPGVQAENNGSIRPEVEMEMDAEPVGASEPAAAADPIEALADGVDTAFGGVLYLINALPHVEGAEGDDVWTRSDRVGGWGVLELAGRGLLADAQNLDFDPIWRALAVLDGREPDELPEREPWLDDLLPKLRERLAEALFEDASSTAPWSPELVTQLLTVPGRLYVTRTHVDLVAPLDQISLPVRRAGLDRDPGWVPELGRVVLFHFR